MGSARQSALYETPLLNPGRLARLNALSVTTVEDLTGLITADAPALSRFLEIDDLAALQSELYLPVGFDERFASATLEPKDHPLGALLPADETEEVASIDTFEQYAATSVLVGAESGSGDFAGTASSADVSDVPPAVRLGCATPVREQGGRWTCVAHAIAAVIECLRQTAGLPGDDLSEQLLYWSAKQNDGLPYDRGTWVSVGMRCATETGICLEATWPYNPIQLPSEDQGPPPPAALPEALGMLLGRAETLPPKSPEHIRAAIDSGRPVAISVPVFANWERNPAIEVFGKFPMPLPTSVRTGGHAMCVMGYADDERYSGGGYFAVKNSWGTDWATQSVVGPGYGLLPYEYIHSYGGEAATGDLSGS